jgi:hypothetical protein
MWVSVAEFVVQCDHVAACKSWRFSSVSHDLSYNRWLGHLELICSAYALFVRFAVMIGTLHGTDASCFFSSADELLPELWGGMRMKS